MVDEHRILFESLLSAGTIILSGHGKAICFTKNENGPYILIVSELLIKIYHEVEQIFCQKFGQVDILHSLREWKQTVLSRSEPASSAANTEESIFVSTAGSNTVREQSKLHVQLT